ncbi:MAG: NTP transferase domain-containing protein, partial [Candidatus Omnitrophica bacterium]|nr:NTP transferase domain-containing protein [Candidatus Omnitrophota bacterium]
MLNTLADTEVLILCGGLGKRLRKVSGKTPKCMVTVADRPFLDIIINYLANLGLRRFILGIGYKADVFKRYYRGRHKGLKISFCREKNPLGTGGAVKNAGRLIKGKYFFVLNGDSFCRFDPGRFLKFHRKKHALASILLSKQLEGKDYGEIKTSR